MSMASAEGSPKGKVGKSAGVGKREAKRAAGVQQGLVPRSLIRGWGTCFDWRD